MSSVFYIISIKNTVGLFLYILPSSGNNCIRYVETGGIALRIQMSELPVKKVFLDSETANEDGLFEFTVDCGAVYFGAVYDGDGQLTTVDQYFYTENYSREDLESAAKNVQLLSVDTRDYKPKTYLLTKMESEQEWLRFHAIVPQEINPDYFYQKYVGE